MNPPQFPFLLIPTTSCILHTFSSTQPQQSFNEHLLYTTENPIFSASSPPPVALTPPSTISILPFTRHNRKLMMCTYCFLARFPPPHSSHLPNCPFPPINPKSIYHSFTVSCSNNDIPIPAADSSTLFSLNP